MITQNGIVYHKLPCGDLVGPPESSPPQGYKRDPKIPNRFYRGQGQVAIEDKPVAKNSKPVQSVPCRGCRGL